MAVLNDSTYVINGAIPTPERVGYALHVFNQDGEVVRSFDESQVGLPEGGLDSTWRVLAIAGGGRGIWSASRSAYRIDLWDEGGAKRRSIIREAPWFPPHSGLVELNPERPLPPGINGMVEDSRGRLWIAIHIASDRWPDCFERNPPDEHPMAGEYRIRAGCRLWDDRIEVLNPETGSILAAQSITQDLADGRSYWFKLFAGGSMFSVSSDDLGFSILREWRPILRPANNTQGGEQCRTL